MEVKASVKTVRITPRKARLTLDLVRGKSVKEALAILSVTNKSSSPVVAKLIKSAAANATHNFKLDESKLVVKSIQATDGVRMKRFMPRAKGSASSIIKRTCHIFVVVADE